MSNNDNEYSINITTGETGETLTIQHKIPESGAESGELNRVCDLLDSLEAQGSILGYKICR